MANILLGLMPDEIRRELLLSGADFELRAGESVPSEQLVGDYVFIVESGVVSKLQVSDTGRISEIGMVGREGLFPLAALLGLPTAPHNVICQVELMHGRRVRTREFHAIVAGRQEAEQIVRKYIYSFVTQLSSNIVSAEQSMVGAKLARWLLMCHDRIDGDRIAVTHDMLAQMIFSHRPTVTNSLKSMREEGLIGMERGAIVMRDRNGLRRMSDGYYGLSERYWQEHIGPFGKDRLIPSREPEMA